MLDADAFEAFEEAGDIFDAATAKRLHEYIYSAGNRREPADAYDAFRGRAPVVEALLEKRGLRETPAVQTSGEVCEESVDRIDLSFRGGQRLNPEPTIKRDARHPVVGSGSSLQRRNDSRTNHAEIV